MQRRYLMISSSGPRFVLKTMPEGMIGTLGGGYTSSQVRAALSRPISFSQAPLHSQALGPDIASSYDAGSSSIDPANAKSDGIAYQASSPSTKVNADPS